MIKTDPIIAVRNVEKSAQWYQSLLGCESSHGGNEFAVLVDENKSVILCLHKWGAHEHPTLMDQNSISGNGLLLYLRTDRLETIWANANNMGSTIAEEIRPNPNSGKHEFAVRDPDGYYLLISAYHEYQG